MHITVHVQAKQGDCSTEGMDIVVKLCYLSLLRQTVIYVIYVKQKGIV